VCVCVFTCFNAHNKRNISPQYTYQKNNACYNSSLNCVFLQGYYWFALNPFVNNEKTAVFVQKGIIYIYLYKEVLEPYIQLAFLMQI